MSALSPKHAIGALVACAALLTLPAAAGAQTPGGMTYSGPGADGSQVSVIGQILGKQVKVSGSLAGVRQGEGIEIQRGDANNNWTPLITVIAGPGGRFTASWKPLTAERMTIRAVPTGATTRSALTLPIGNLTIFAKTTATWFGPGFYGARTACGKRMTRSLLGVAHKTLPCGSRVEVFYKGRSLILPVVDRGPFRKRTEYDLTAAAARKLKISHVTTIGALPVQ